MLIKFYHFLWFAVRLLGVMGSAKKRIAFSLLGVAGFYMALGGMQMDLVCLLLKLDQVIFNKEIYCHNSNY